MKKGWTLLVLRGPGRRARQLEVGRREVLVAGGLLMGFGGGLGLGLSRLLRPVSEPVATAPRLAVTLPTPIKVIVPPPEPDSGPSLPIQGADEPRDDAGARELQHAPEGPPVIGRLQIYSVNTSEFLDITPFGDDGTLDQAAFRRLKYLMRCTRTGRMHLINPRLVQLLLKISQACDDKPIRMISGYRAPGVNGTSPDSFHTKGSAIDIRVSGVAVRDLWALAKRLGAAGAGLYVKHKFVHVDVGDRIFHWQVPWTVDGPEMEPGVDIFDDDPLKTAQPEDGDADPARPAPPVDEKADPLEAAQPVEQEAESVKAPPPVEGDAESVKASPPVDEKADPPGPTSPADGEAETVKSAPAPDGDEVARPG
jgi:uncharacterized protein YcbK (DUF882 family)